MTTKNHAATQTGQDDTTAFLMLCMIAMAVGSIFAIRHAHESKVNNMIDQLLSKPQITYLVTPEAQQRISLGSSLHRLLCERGAVAYRTDNLADRDADLQTVCARVWTQHVASAR